MEVRMHPLAQRHFEEVFKDFKLRGPCKNYCPLYKDCGHDKGKLEDGTWCYCPFYPCRDETLGGKWIRSGVWSCQGCTWIHRGDVAKEVLNKLKALGIQRPEDLEEEREAVLRIREEIKAKFPEI